MTGKERVRATFNREKVDRNPFWKGNPTSEVEELLCEHFSMPTGDSIALSEQLGDDFVWLPAGAFWKHPEGKGMFSEIMGKRETLSEGGGTYADVTLENVDTLPWPDAEYIDVDGYINHIQKANDKGLAVFLEACGHLFFHLVADFFGMEDYFIKMYTEPELVEAVTHKFVDFFT